MDKGYLVLVEADLISGKTVSDIDVFREDNSETAQNDAVNVFIKEGDGAVIYGKTVFLVAAIAALRAKVIGVVDLQEAENAHLLAAADVYEVFLKDYETQKSNRSRRSLPGS
jgi:hypothetical protein